MESDWRSSKSVKRIISVACGNEKTGHTKPHKRGYNCTFLRCTVKTAGDCYYIIRVRVRFKRVKKMRREYLRTKNEWWMRFSSHWEFSLHKNVYAHVCAKILSENFSIQKKSPNHTCSVTPAFLSRRKVLAYERIESVFFSFWRLRQDFIRFWMKNIVGNLLRVHM